MYVVLFAFGFCIILFWFIERRVGIGMVFCDDLGFILSYGIVFEYIDDLMIFVVFFEIGLENGGIMFLVFVNGLIDGARYSCRIGIFFLIMLYNI